jgi:hypothetical protein
MPTTLDFLRAILPAKGVYCAVVVDQTRSFKRQIFYPTVEALAEGVLKLDQKLGDTRAAVYHGCAAYSRRSRTKDAVRSLSALWLDVDAGPGKPYADQAAAIAAVQHFVALGAPVPLVVASGRGLHCYWPLADELDRPTWERYAERLKALCAERGLEAGRERTADCASILRPPGTTHRKGATPLPVLCGPIPPKVTHEQLEAFLGAVAVEDRRVTSAPVSSLRRPVGLHRPASSGLAAKLANVTALEPIDFEALCAGCAQMRAFRDDNATYGPVQEPTWYAAVGVLAWCANGDSVAHAWSAKHPNYSERETADRLTRSRALSGPSLCARFRDLEPKRCEDCRFGQTTPLDAARAIRIEKTPPPTLANLPVTIASNVVGCAVDGHDEYQYKNGGLYFTNDDPNGKRTDVKIASFPVQIASVHTGELNADSHYYLVRHFKPHAGWREVTLPASKLHGREAGSVMADLGVIIHDLPRFGMFVRDSVDTLQAKQRSRMQYEQFGWKDDGAAFLWGDRLYSARGIATTAISEQLRYRAQWLCPVPGGSLENWKNAVDSLMGSGSEGMSFTVLASFAAVLMKFLEGDEGGAVVSLVTRQSGAGKTTSLAGAYTVWANDLHALSIVTIDTKVSKASLMGRLHNLPVIFDEFTSKDPALVREFITTFTSGRDKNRADASGNLINNAFDWQTLLLTASNKSLVDTILSTGEGDAPAMRILELPVNSSGDLKPAEAQALKRELEKNAGWAGEAFLAALMIPGVLDWTRKRMPLLMDEIYARGSFRKEHRFWVRTLAAVGVAAAIVENYGLISFSPQRIMRWAIQHFSAKRSGGLLDADALSMLPQLARFLNERLDETLTMPGPIEGRKRQQPIGETPRRKVSIRAEIEGGVVWVACAPLREFLERLGGGYADLVAELASRDMLKADHKLVTLTAGSDLRSGQVLALGFAANHPAFDGIIREAPSLAAALAEAAIERLRGVETASKR